MPLNINSFISFETRAEITEKKTDFWSQPSVIYTQIFSPKNTFQTFFDFCSPLFYALFSADPNIFSKKN